MGFTRMAILDQGPQAGGRLIANGAVLEHTGTLTGIKTTVKVTRIALGEPTPFIEVEDKHGRRWRASSSVWESEPFKDFRVLEEGRGKRSFARGMR